MATLSSWKEFEIGTPRGTTGSGSEQSGSFSAKTQSGNDFDATAMAEQPGVPPAQPAAAAAPAAPRYPPTAHPLPTPPPQDRPGPSQPAPVDPKGPAPAAFRPLNVKDALRCAIAWLTLFAVADRSPSFSLQLSRPRQGHLQRPGRGCVLLQRIVYLSLLWLPVYDRFLMIMKEFKSQVRSFRVAQRRGGKRKANSTVQGIDTPGVIERVRTHWDPSSRRADGSPATPGQHAVSRSPRPHPGLQHLPPTRLPHRMLRFDLDASGGRRRYDHYRHNSDGHDHAYPDHGAWSWRTQSSRYQPTDAGKASPQPSRQGCLQSSRRATPSTRSKSVV